MNNIFALGFVSGHFYIQQKESPGLTRRLFALNTLHKTCQEVSFFSRLHEKYKKVFGTSDLSFYFCIQNRTSIAC